MKTMLMETIGRQQRASVDALELLERATKAIVAIDEIPPKRKREIGMHIEQAQSKLRQVITSSGQILATTFPEDD